MAGWLCTSIRPMPSVCLSIILVCLVFCTRCVVGKGSKDFEFIEKDSLQRGESSLNTMETRASSLAASDNSCWKSALEDLKSDCRSMNELQQRLIAVRFANCHFERSGLRTYPCTADNFLVCTREMAEGSSLAFTTYTEFFGKVVDICHYLKSDMWRENTKKVISKLSETSKDVVDKLKDSSEKQDLLLSIQHLSIENQEKILQSGKLIQDAVTENAKEAIREFAEAKKRAEKKSKWLDDSFEKLITYLNRIMTIFDSLFGHFTILQSSLFYVFSFFFWLFACSSPHVANARFLVSTSLLLFCIMEILFTSLVTSKDQVWIDRCVWKLRCVLYVISFITCFYHWVKTDSSATTRQKARNQELDQIDKLSSQIRSLQKHLGYQAANVSHVQGYWSRGDSVSSPYDSVDHGHDLISAGPHSAFTKLRPASSSTPKKEPVRRTGKTMVDSGVGADILGSDSLGTGRKQKPKTARKLLTDAEVKCDDILKKTFSDGEQSSHNLSRHSYNLRSRRSCTISRNETHL